VHIEWTDWQDWDVALRQLSRTTVLLLDAGAWMGGSQCVGRSASAVTTFQFMARAATS
jgi:hypothetical protein